jgi:alcohol dehydrogenase (NADP+)
MKTWRQMEKLVEMGLVRHIGTSNVTIPKMKLLLRDAKIKPAANEMELHPHFQQPEFFKYCIVNAILPIGFAPIGSPTRPDRDKSPDDTIDIQDPVIVKIAARLNVHPAVVCIKWAVQRGQVPIPFSIYPKEYLSNLMAAAVDPLTEEEMQEIAGIDKNNRLIKGQVFLWESAKDWRDLWDLDGQIAA